MMGKRNRKVEHRPTEILLPRQPGEIGPPRKIVIDLPLSKSNETILDGGRQVHERLERAVQAAPVLIEVESRVDKIGLRSVIGGRP